MGVKDNPLLDLLGRLAAGRPTTLAQLAHDLDTSTDLLEQMLSDLDRLGYIHAVDTGCDAHCAGCRRHELCSLIHEGRIWSLTPKGRAMAQRA